VRTRLDREPRREFRFTGYDRRRNGESEVLRAPVVTLTMFGSLREPLRSWLLHRRVSRWATKAYMRCRSGSPARFLPITYQTSIWPAPFTSMTPLPSQSNASLINSYVLRVI
jgi:hypothetical protein